MSLDRTFYPRQLKYSKNIIGPFKAFIVFLVSPYVNHTFRFCSQELKFPCNKSGEMYDFVLFSIMKLCPLIVKKKKILRFPFNIISFPEAMKFFYHRLSSNLVIIPFMVTELCPWIEKWPHYDIAEILLKLLVLITNQS